MKIETITPSPINFQAIEEASGQKVSACFQCGKCSSGCPLTFAMDILPHELIHFLHYGQLDRVLRSETIWVCASCETCTTRCPNGIDIAHVMDTLRQLAIKEKISTPQHAVPNFHSAFLNSIKRHGRVNETEMILTYSLKEKGIAGVLKLVGYGFSMFRKGKVNPIPHRIKGKGFIKHLFKGI